jgi:hypothetical protein
MGWTVPSGGLTLADEATLYDQVLSRVIRFVEYDSYGWKAKNAAKAIRKKFPYKSLAECEAAFSEVLAVYLEAIALISRKCFAFTRMQISRRASSPGPVP